MGYTHYWYREKEVPKVLFKAIVQDFLKTMPYLEKLGIDLAYGHGEKKPVITNDLISFNGRTNCNHKNRDLGVTWPSENAKGINNGLSDDKDVEGTWFAGMTLNTRTCSGDCSHETCYFPRIVEPRGDWDKPKEDGKWFESCKTAYKPYDLAVNVFLIIVKNHLKEDIIVKSDGELKDWKEGITICHNVLGYGKKFKLDEE